MKRLKSRRILFLGTFTLLVIVGLLSFGERALHGHYHLDGGRGWDLPPSASHDIGHTQFVCAVPPSPSVRFDRPEGDILGFVPLIEAPIPKSAALRDWFRLRPPPQA